LEAVPNDIECLGVAGKHAIRAIIGDSNMLLFPVGQIVRYPIDICETVMIRIGALPKTHVEQKGLHDFPPMAGGNKKGRLLRREGARGPYAIASNDVAALNDLGFTGLPYSLLWRQPFRIHFFFVVYKGNKNLSIFLTVLNNFEEGNPAFGIDSADFSFRRVDGSARLIDIIGHVIVEKRHKNEPRIEFLRRMQGVM
jgi:hypothetical protein